MNPTTELVPLFITATLVILGWGLFRGRQQGQSKLLGWLQGVALLLPWMIFLGLLSAGIYLNIAGFVLLLFLSTLLYIWVGRLRRNAFPDQGTQVSQTERQPNGERSEAQLPSTEQSSLVTEAVAGIVDTDLELIQSIFSVDSFFATNAIPYGEGAIFKGNLRTDAESALDQLTERLTAATGDRFQIYLVNDSEEKPSVVVLPASAVTQELPTAAKALAAGLFVASLLTTGELSANLAGFSLRTSPDRWLEALPVVAGILGLLLLDDIGHRWMARRYGVRLSPPFVIPTFGLGTLGIVSRIESPIPNRKALFDIALAGPAASGMAALGLSIVGLMLSGTGAASEIYLPGPLFQNSILVGSLARLILGAGLNAEVVGIHPLVAVGWLGLAITALSLLPAGQLDGGRIVQAVYGRKISGRATFITLIVLGLAALGNTIALYWALLILLILREPERPPVNEISDTDGQRDALALLALFLMAMTLLPIAPALAGKLGIGMM